ncbi:siroheme synthase CysG [Avibacterium sp. 20-129]|uniref:siroheme synthase CysG n=1 Tax=Avibacterium sp. 20-129 TaxID=2911525 RepID=UPI0022470826|nr:siroheme synthase CysG [Avibacterium sp. 20-129]MCW9699568.1 siroheme synthase CysG [Avibacterium sp. 20-129]
MKYFPLFAELTNRPVLVVGGGAVAARKVSLLLKANAEVRVVAEKLGVELTALWQQERIIWLAKTFHSEQLQQVFFVIAATNDKTLNQRIFTLAENQHKFVNVVDDQAHCSAIFPSIIDRDPIQIAISSGGTAPVLVRLLREKLEARLPQYLGTMATLAGKWRYKVKQRFRSVTQRRRFWEQLFNGRFAQFIKNHQLEQATQELAYQLDSADFQGGSVTLVGAGPGDAGLLTLKGLQEIQQADVVLYDALVSEAVLDLIRRDAQRVFVGKRGRGNSVAQEEINALLVKYAKAGKRVVRLKGGDPFVFGRAGEELEILAQHHIPFSVVPGITAAIGATAYAGIPLTHRDYAQSAVFVTGHRKNDAAEIEWQSLARSQQTLVIYMGTLNAKEIATQLQQFGRASTTPVAVISHGTLETQQTQTGILANLAEIAENAPTPALIVVGEVVALQEKLAWFGEEKQAQKAPHSTFTRLQPKQVA